MQKRNSMQIILAFLIFCLNIIYVLYFYVNISFLWCENSCCFCFISPSLSGCLHGTFEYWTQKCNLDAYLINQWNMQIVYFHLHIDIHLPESCLIKLTHRVLYTDTHSRAHCTHTIYVRCTYIACGKKGDLAWVRDGETKTDTKMFELIYTDFII